MALFHSRFHPLPQGSVSQPRVHVIYMHNCVTVQCLWWHDILHAQISGTAVWKICIRCYLLNWYVCIFLCSVLSISDVSVQIISIFYIYTYVHVYLHIHSKVKCFYRWGMSHYKAFLNVNTFSAKHLIFCTEFYNLIPIFLIDSENSADMKLSHMMFL